MLELFNHPMPSPFVEELNLRRLREREDAFSGPSGSQTRESRLGLVVLVLLLALFVS